MAAGLRPVRPAGTTTYMVRGKSSATMTCAPYDPLQINASGQVLPITAATQSIYGSAAQVATAVPVNTTILLWPAQDGMVWEAEAAGTPTQAQVGTQVDFSVFTSGGMRVNTASTVNGQVQFVGPREFNRAFIANDAILVNVTKVFNSYAGS